MACCLVCSMYVWSCSTPTTWRWCSTSSTSTERHRPSPPPPHPRADQQRRRRRSLPTAPPGFRPVGVQTLLLVGQGSSTAGGISASRRRVRRREGVEQHRLRPFQFERSSEQRNSTRWAAAVETASSTTYAWLSPRPPDGPLTFFVEWPPTASAKRARESKLARFAEPRRRSTCFGVSSAGGTRGHRLPSRAHPIGVRRCAATAPRTTGPRADLGHGHGQPTSRCRHWHCDEAGDRGR